MSEFFKFPHTSHLTWLADGAPREDKVLAAAATAAFLDGPVIIEEKLDGANIGLSIVEGEIRIQNRGQYVPQPFDGQYAKLDAWLQVHRHGILDTLEDHCILFGEWCAASHSIAYDSLPGLFLAFDIYDRQAGSFWTVADRNLLASHARLPVVPEIARGLFTLEEVISLVTESKSCFTDAPLEGVVLRREEGRELDRRAKVVRADFVQTIDDHWRSRKIVWNTVEYR